MTDEERFTRIETDLAATAKAVRAIAAMHASTQRVIAGLTQQIGSYVDAADARMRRIEENLDGLIRAITAENTRGKGSKP